MAYEMKENSGSLFKNERREKDTHAHARGSALIDGVEYRIVRVSPFAPAGEVIFWEVQTRDD
mgnify:CR=1 FL=1